jgi:hypothetical protein
MRLDVIAHAALFILLLIASTQLASAINLPSGIENFLPVRFPELLTAPAPPWLGEGMRATYSVLASSSETEHLDTKNLGTGDVGNGIADLDVVAVENGEAAILNEAYSPGAGLQGYVSAAGLQGALRPLTEVGTIDPVGCGDFWCSPDVLKRIPVMANNNGLTAQRLPYTTSGGKTYQAIRFDFIDTDLQESMVYDLDTGILLYHTFDYSSFNPRGANQVPTSGSRHATYEFVNLRQVTLPWKNGHLPSWLAQGNSMSYQGQMSIQVQGASPVTTAMAMRVDVIEAHDRFADLKMEIYDQSTGTTATSRVVRGVAELMGNWMPIEAIATLSPGVIDTDPYTGMRVSVIQKDNDAVVFEKTNQQDFRELYAYDSSGKLVQAYYEYNPYVMTSSGFGSVKTIMLQFAG